MYQDLLAMERRLDWTMTRKRTEVQDAMGRPITVCSVFVSYLPLESYLNVFVELETTRTLRIFLSHTVSGQAWQQTTPADPISSNPPSADGTNVNLETGEGIPAWQFKIEGRLLEVCSLF